MGAKVSREVQIGSAAPMNISATAVEQAREDKEIIYFNHPEHPLVLTDLPYLFTCLECKEYGAGPRFRCCRCNLDIHAFCAAAPASLADHPLHEMSHQLIFFTKSGGILHSKCNVCGKPVKGCFFGCSSCTFQMHPCCAMLRGELNFPVHQHQLLISPTPKTDEELRSVCQLCLKKRAASLIYRCSICTYYWIHATCAKNLANGLYAHGIVPPERSANVVAATARLAASAFFGLVGALLEGVGEGIGEALVSSIGRGSRRVRSTRSN